MARHVLLALALCGCTERFLDVPGRDSPLGLGLEGSYEVVQVTCELGRDYPDDCPWDYQSITRLRSRGAIEVARSEAAWRFSAFGVAVGLGEAAIDTDESSSVFEITVEPVTYSELRWLEMGSGRYQSIHNKSLRLEQFGPALADSEIRLNQVHYRKTRAELDAFRATNDGLGYRSTDGFYLHGTTPWKLDRGATDAALSSIVFDTIFGKRDIGVLHTGSVLGPVRLGTHVGGDFAVDIVDARAIRSLTTLDGNAKSVETLGRDSYNVKNFELVPVGADGRLIAGCPVDGPEVFDELGMFVITRKPEQNTPFCSFTFEWDPYQGWQDTTIVARWNGVELRVPVVPGYSS